MHWFRAKWTEEIHAEWATNLLKQRPDIQLGALLRTQELMNSVIDDCLVTDYEPITQTLLLPDEGDKHVLAAAIHSKSTIIVTANMKDFPTSSIDQHGIEAMTADDFI